jgi:SAM-dependent methyltransferase
MKLPTLLAKHVLSKQLARPTGFFGRYIMGRLLNRTTSAHNELILQELAVQPSDRVLEVGFGGGALLANIAQQASAGFVAGLELSEEMVANASARMEALVTTGRVEIRQGSVESLPYPEAHFNKACSVNTVYFWPDLARCFAEFSRAGSAWNFSRLCLRNSLILNVISRTVTNNSKQSGSGQQQNYGSEG